MSPTQNVAGQIVASTNVTDPHRQSKLFSPLVDFIVSSSLLSIVNAEALVIEYRI